MADNDSDPPQDPPNDPPPDPDPNGAAELARIQDELKAAGATVTKALDLTKTALRAANPLLPDAVFDAPDLDTLVANVESHKATAEHIKAQIAANPGAKPPPATPPGAGTTRQVTVPDNLRGSRRIAFALNNPGPGMTE